MASCSRVALRSRAGRLDGRRLSLDAALTVGVDGRLDKCIVAFGTWASQGLAVGKVRCGCVSLACSPSSRLICSAADARTKEHKAAAMHCATCVMRCIVASPLLGRWIPGLCVHGADKPHPKTGPTMSCLRH